MPLDVNLVGENNGGESAQVSSYGTLRVSQTDSEPPLASTDSRLRYFSELLGSTGAGSGVTNMNVDGSVTPEEFFISANEDYDLRIMAIVVVIAAQTVSHNAFGGVPILPVGWELDIVEAGSTTKVVDLAKTSGQVIAQSGFTNPYGSGATSFQLTKWTANDDAHTINIPIGSYIPNGIRIGRGTKDKIVSIVNDDLTGNNEFTVRVIGYRHYP
ncbi:MAG: hypothetical protein GQ474_07885 [Sulfurimonas sp.]|nr:hypothetical protein [Sulfurimonas sp.]